MNRSNVNFIIDVVAFAAFVLLAATGGIIKFVLPQGSGHFSMLWGMDRHGWGEIHFWIAIVVATAMVLHVILHWQWIVGMIHGASGKGSRIRVALAIVAALLLAGLAVAPYCGKIEQKGNPPHKMRSGQQTTSPEVQIDGSMTLQEVEQRTGVSTTIILRELGLPPDVPTDERLGRLRKKHNFEIHAIREIVEKHDARH
jgi:hypothetical protein